MWRITGELAGIPKPPVRGHRCANLPLTNDGVVDRTIPSLGVIDAVGEGSLVLRQLAPGVTADDVIAVTSVEVAVELS